MLRLHPNLGHKLISSEISQSSDIVMNSFPVILSIPMSQIKFIAGRQSVIYWKSQFHKLLFYLSTIDSMTLDMRFVKTLTRLKNLHDPPPHPYTLKSDVCHVLLPEAVIQDDPVVRFWQTDFQVAHSTVDRVTTI